MVMNVSEVRAMRNITPADTGSGQGLEIILRDIANLIKLDGLSSLVSSLSYRVEVLMGNILILFVVFDPEYIYKCTPCP